VVRAVVWGIWGAPLWAHAQGGTNTPAPPGPPAPPADPSAPRPRVTFGSGSTAIALLLPPQDGPFGRASASLLAGVMAGHTRDGEGVKVEVFEVEDQADQLALVYGELQDRRFALALGPLTRNGTTALLELGGVAVPTLALNLPERDLPVPPRIAFFGLATETESRQAASQAFTQVLDRAGTRRPRAAGIMVASPLARRSVQAFRDAWVELGGNFSGVVEFTGPRPSRDLRARLGTPAPDVVFLAMGAEQARVLRSAVGAETAVWSTSLASIGNTAQLRLPELDGLRLLEMPWQVEPDNPAVMSYPKAPAGFNVEMQRLYALGIDAFRIGRQMVSSPGPFQLDGVTGRLRFDPQASPRIDRTAVPSEYRNGVPVAIQTPQ
jgi:outer membrane PBP1 activator LpoA protein